MFIDRVKVHVRAGKGGRGAVSFRREKYVPLGGPDGGDGGRGGDVVFHVDPGETTLVTLHGRPWYAAKDGGNGSGANKRGADGASICLPVPPGTVVRNAETGEMLHDLVGEDQAAIVAAGGKGGKGNAAFANSTHQTPQYAQPGLPGEELDLLVELKMVADVALVGFPNAGKSSLLNAITRARSRIGDYPFTTLHPVLGSLPLLPEESAEFQRMASEGGSCSKAPPRIILADVPGILEGAHQGVGLGLEFLRHIERTQALLFVLDVSVARERDPLEAYEALLEEIGSYARRLLDLPRLVALNKIDEALEEEIEAFAARLIDPKAPVHSIQLGGVFPISSLEKVGLEPLRDALVQLLHRLRAGAHALPMSHPSLPA
ncbi:MAG: Obg family GTPase CgtA [Candidatus Omnitrophica bacterium]|nr:Obg family GTPase CgtA [Candidatus Omnitrophota bacterium]